MKKLFTLLLLLTFGYFANAQDPFITTWKTDNPGTTNDQSINIKVTGSGFNYDVDWDNDGVYDELGINGQVFHDFGAPGTYTIRIRGDFPRIYFDASNNDRRKIISIDQWGDIAWSSMEGAFAGCLNMINNATDAPDLSNVTDMENMFFLAEVFDGDLSNWDVSNVTNMRGMFDAADAFNGDVSNWNVSNVTDMFGMFSGADVFNGDVSGWDVSNVSIMAGMFRNTDFFNADISNWNVSNVTHMDNMFHSTDAFNVDISGWDVSNTNRFTSMFFNAQAFDQDLGTWDLASATHLSFMLFNCGMSIESYDNTLIGWNSQGFTGQNLSNATGLDYCVGKAARDNLVNNLGWTITNDDYACPVSTQQTDACFSIPAVDISAANGNNNEEIYLFDNTGNFVGSINANGNDLGITNITVYVSSTDRFSNGTAYMNRDISIVPTTQPSTPVTVKTFYTAAEWAALQAADPQVNVLSALEYVKTDAACTGVLTGTPTLIGQNTSGSFGSDGNIFLTGDFPSFSNIHVKGNLSPLPVELISFEARKSDSNVFLEWTTSSELNNKGFELQRSFDGEKWAELTFIPGKSNSRTLQNYSYIDRSPHVGHNYYRLKQVDQNERFEYSEVRSVEIKNVEDKLARVYPNPNNGKFQIERLDSSNDLIEMTLMDARGNIISDRILESSWLGFALTETGIYFVKISSRNKSEIHKVIIN